MWTGSQTDAVSPLLDALGLLGRLFALLGLLGLRILWRRGGDFEAVVRLIFGDEDGTLILILLAVSWICLRDGEVLYEGVLVQLISCLRGKSETYNWKHMFASFI